MVSLSRKAGEGRGEGLHLYISCECGARLVDQMAHAFEQGFLDDGYGLRAKLGIPELPSRHEIAAADYVTWYEQMTAALAAGAAALPTLYQVWLRTSATRRTGRAVYFQAGNDFYFVFASMAPELVAQKLPAGWLREKMLPAQKQSTGHAQDVIPRVEDARRPLQAPDPGGNIRLSPEEFEDLFADSGVELEALPFADVFARDLRDLGAAAAHASRCGRALQLRHF